MLRILDSEEIGSVSGADSAGWAASERDTLIDHGFTLHTGPRSFGTWYPDFGNTSNGGFGVWVNTDDHLVSDVEFSC